MEEEGAGVGGGDEDVEEEGLDADAGGPDDADPKPLRPGNP